MRTHPTSCRNHHSAPFLDVLSIMLPNQQRTPTAIDLYTNVHRLAHGFLAPDVFAHTHAHTHQSTQSQNPSHSNLGLVAPRKNQLATIRFKASAFIKNSPSRQKLMATAHAATVATVATASAALGVLLGLALASLSRTRRKRHAPLVFEGCAEHRLRSEAGAASVTTQFRWPGEALWLYLFL